MAELRMRQLGLIFCTLLIFASAAVADDAEFFEKKIRPLLVENCYECHSAKSEELKGGLRLDTREGVLKGGETGAIIVGNDPEKSLIIQAVRYKNEKLQMPPDGKLSDAQIADLETWVRMGAPDPRGPVIAIASRPATGPSGLDPARLAE